MFRSRKWRIIAAIVLILGVGVAFWPFGQGGPCDANERFVVDQNGKRFLEARWPMGREDHLFWLRMPAEYAWRANTGCISVLGANYQDPDVVGPYSSMLFLEVLLPDFTPKNFKKPDLRFLSGPEWSSMIVQISTLVRAPAEEKADMGGMLRDAERIFLNPDSYSAKKEQLTYGPKPDRFGLKRVGAIGDMARYRTEFGGLAADDFYFPDHQPIDMWIRCQAEEIKDYTEDPGWGLRTPPCEQHFYSPSLDANVLLDYRRIYLPRWREWQEKTEELLRSFPMTKANPRTDRLW
jgi:hypothetical protein